MKKIKSQKPARSMGIKKIVIFKTKKGRVEKGGFLGEKEKWGVFPEEAVGNWSYMGSCREVLRVKSGKGEEGDFGKSIQI